MAEEQTPNPTLEEGAETQAEPQEQEQSLAEIQQLLESAGVNSPKQLEGKLEASQNYYNVSQLLKEERQRNEELQRQLLEGQKTTVRPKNDDFDLDAINPGETIDLSRVVGGEVRKAVRSEWENIQKEQRRNQEMAVKQYGKIRNDDLYPKVGKLFEEKMKDPTFAYEIQSGMRDPVEEYRNLKDEFYQNIIKEAHGTITKLQGSGKMQQPPHVEMGDRTGNIVSEEKPQTGKQKILEAARNKVKNQGVLDDEDELSLIDSIFPDPL